jgi:hypothetical protein
VSERDGAFFAIIGAAVSGERRQFEIGLTPDAYRAITRVLQARPFDQLPGLKYRYFFVPSIDRLPARAAVEADFRIEQGNVGRHFRFEIPEALAANLMWFFKLNDFALASHLRRVDVNS